MPPAPVKRKSPLGPKAVTPSKGTTLNVRSTNHSGGMTPGQMAVMEDTDFTRRMLNSGLWELLVTPDELDPPEDDSEEE